MLLSFNILSVIINPIYNWLQQIIFSFINNLKSSTLEKLQKIWFWVFDEDLWIRSDMPKNRKKLINKIINIICHKDNNFNYIIHLGDKLHFKN